MKKDFVSMTVWYGKYVNLVTSWISIEISVEGVVSVRADYKEEMWCSVDRLMYIWG